MAADATVTLTYDTWCKTLYFAARWKNPLNMSKSVIFYLKSLII